MWQTNVINILHFIILSVKFHIVGGLTLPRNSAHRFPGTQDSTLEFTSSEEAEITWLSYTSVLRVCSAISKPKGDPPPETPETN